MVSHIRTFPAIMPYLRQSGAVLFYLYRRDVFATALSFYKAKASGVFHSDSPAIKGSPVSMLANEDHFDQLVQECRRDKQHLHELQRMYGGRLIAYEDMIADWDDIIATIGDDIGLTQLRLQKSLSRIGGDRRSIVIENEQVLRDRYQMPAAE